MGCRDGIDTIAVDASGHFAERGDDLKCNKGNNLVDDEEDRDAVDGISTVAQAVWLEPSGSMH
jgi:hypothetical protein